MHTYIYIHILVLVHKEYFDSHGVSESTETITFFIPKYLVQE